MFFEVARPKRPCYSMRALLNGETMRSRFPAYIQEMVKNREITPSEALERYGMSKTRYQQFAGPTADGVRVTRAMNNEVDGLRAMFKHHIDEMWPGYRTSDLAKQAQQIREARRDKQ